MTSDELKAAGVRVKPLEWQESAEGYASGQWFAASIFGEYSTVGPMANEMVLMIAPVPRLGNYTERFSTIDAAKSAAQSDYEARILAALEAS